MSNFKGKVLVWERLFVSGVAIAVAWAYFYEFQKTAKMSGDFGPGTVVAGAVIALLCNVGLFLTQTSFARRHRVFVTLSLLPSLLISPIVIGRDDSAIPFIFMAMVGFLIVRTLNPRVAA